MRFQLFFGRNCDRCTIVSLLGVVAIICVTSIPYEVSAGSQDEVCVNDFLSRQVCVSSAPKRVISLAPSLTETLFILKAGHLIIGRTTRCNAPREAQNIRDIGAYMNPDMERVMSLKPDLVLSPKTGVRKELVDRLTEVGIPVFVDDSNDLDEIVELVRKLGIILAMKSEAEKVIETIQQRRATMNERIADLDKPAVLFVIGMRPLIVAGGKSFLGALIREAGGANIAEEASVPYPRFSMEEVIRRDPEFIIVVNKECLSEECIQDWRKYQVLRAVRNSRIYGLEADLMSRPTPGIIEALEQLAAIFHPGTVTAASPGKLSN